MPDSGSNSLRRRATVATGSAPIPRATNVSAASDAASVHYASSGLVAERTGRADHTAEHPHPRPVFRR
jgi:hypothetical protein